MIGENRFTNILLRYLGEEKKLEIESYILSLASRNFCNIGNDNSAMMSDFLNKLTPDEAMFLRSYTGYQFKNINACLRNNWNYEENGLLTPEIEQKYNDLSKKISSIVSKFPSLDNDFIVYRGVDLSTFASYGIKTISDLKSMQGKYFYEKGFTSTSTNRDNSFFNRALENGKMYNIEIQYLIPRESSDGILLSGNDLSFSPGQNEYLINKDSLTKIIDVEIDENSNQARLIAVLVPKKIWSMEEQKENENKQQPK